MNKGSHKSRDIQGKFIGSIFENREGPWKFETVFCENFSVMGANRVISLLTLF